MDSIVTLVAFVVMFIGLIIVYKLENSCKKEQRKYLESLDEHDKAVLMGYITCSKYHLFKKRDKNNEK